MSHLRNPLRNFTTWLLAQLVLFTASPTLGEFCFQMHLSLISRLGLSRVLFFAGS